jgi:LPS-assembly protein
LVIALGLFLLTFIIPEKTSASEPLRIQADFLSFEERENRYVAKGQVHLSMGAWELLADEVIFYPAQSKALASGNVKLKSQEDWLSGDRLELDTSQVTGVVFQGRAYLAENNIHLRAERIQKTGPQTYRAYEAFATTCDGDNPDWQISGRELVVTLDGYGTLRHGKFLIRNQPVLYFPYLVFPAKTTRQSGFLMPQIAFSREIHGLDVEIPYFLALTANQDATIYLRYLENSGVKPALEYRYFWGEKSSGSFYGDYLQDRRFVSETKGNITRNWPAGMDRWSLYWQHESFINPNLYLRWDVLRLSDIWYFRDFAAASYYLENYIEKGQNRFRRVAFKANEALPAVTSTARLSWQQEGYYANLLWEHTDDLTKEKNDATLQKYPEISLGGIRREIWEGMAQWEWNGHLTYNHRETGDHGLWGRLRPAFFRPVNIQGVASLVPSVTLDGTFWHNDEDKSGRERWGERYLYHLEVKGTTEVARIFTVNFRGVEKIRHSLQPRIEYRFTPEQSQANLPSHVPALPAESLLTYGLTNFFTARATDAEGKRYYRDFLRLKLSQVYNFREATRELVPGGPKRRPWGDVLIELDVTPLPTASFLARNSYDLYGNEWREAHYDLNLLSPRGDRLTMSYRHTRDLLEEALLSAKAVVSRDFDLTYTHRRNLRDLKDLEKTLALTYRQQCWQVQVSYSVKEEDTRVMFNLSLYGLGTIGN